MARIIFNKVTGVTNLRRNIYCRDYFMTKESRYASFLIVGKFLLRGGGSFAQLNIFGKNSLAKGLLDENFFSVGRGIMTRDFFSELISWSTFLRMIIS